MDTNNKKAERIFRRFTLYIIGGIIAAIISFAYTLINYYRFGRLSTFSLVLGLTVIIFLIVALIKGKKSAEKSKLQSNSIILKKPGYVIAFIIFFFAMQIIGGIGALIMSCYRCSLVELPPALKEVHKVDTKCITPGYCDKIKEFFK